MIPTPTSALVYRNSFFRISPYLSDLGDLRFGRLMLGDVIRVPGPPSRVSALALGTDPIMSVQTVVI